MKNKLLLICIVLSLTSCFQQKSDISASVQSQVDQGISPEDFLNKLRIKIEVFKSGKNGYVTGDNQDHKKWVSDSIENFEGVWISDSKVLGNWAFKYKFSLLSDGRLSLDLERYKSKVRKSSHPDLGKFLGNVKYIFKGTDSISFKLDMYDNDFKSPTVSFTPILTKN